MSDKQIKIDFSLSLEITDCLGQMFPTEPLVQELKQLFQAYAEGETPNAPWLKLAKKAKKAYCIESKAHGFIPENPKQGLRLNESRSARGAMLIAVWLGTMVGLNAIEHAKFQSSKDPTFYQKKIWSGMKGMATETANAAGWLACPNRQVHLKAAETQELYFVAAGVILKKFTERRFEMELSTT